MKLAAIGYISTLFIILAISVLALLNWNAVELAMLELVLVGRIPGVEMYLTFEAFLSGFLVVTWIIWVLKIYSYCHDQIANLLVVENKKIDAIEEVAL